MRVSERGKTTLRVVPSMLVTAAMASIFLGIPLTLPSSADSAAQATVGKLSVKSNTFANGGPLPMSVVFNGSGCTGGNRSPELTWGGEPSGTAAFAVILHDPDAPTATGWYHWVVFNIPPNVHELKEGAGATGSPDLPAGAVLGLTDFGFSGYGGPCPPVGDRPHHYVFTVYALASKVDGGPKTTATALRSATQGSTLATGTITGLYGR